MKKHQPSTFELTRSQITKPTHPIVRLLEANGYEPAGFRERGELRTFTKDGAEIDLRFHGSLFTRAVVKESDTRNLGHFSEGELIAYLGGLSCLNQEQTPWDSIRWCKRIRGHDGACRDSDGDFEREAS